jgi:hypothetical protein
MQSKYYIIVNKEGEAYAGMVEGSLTWTPDWDRAKKLLQENTTRILDHHPGTELLSI